MSDLYKNYFDSMPCYLTVQDKDLHLVAANQKFQKEFGEIDGRYCYQIYKNRSEKCEVCPVEKTFRDRLPHSCEERVTNLDASIKFYCDVLGMRLLRRKDYPEGKFTLAFVGYGEEADTTVLELTHNWDVSQYDLGDAYGHVAVGVGGQPFPNQRLQGCLPVRQFQFGQACPETVIIDHADLIATIDTKLK